MCRGLDPLRDARGVRWQAASALNHAVSSVTRSHCGGDHTVVNRKPWKRLHRAVSEEWKRRCSRWFAWPQMSIMPVRAAKLHISTYTWMGACHCGSRKRISNHSTALERLKQSASCWTTPVPRHQKLVNVWHELLMWWTREALAPPTCRPSYHPLEETVAVTMRTTMPGCRHRERRSSTHPCLSCGAHWPMWFRCSSQLGTSQGGTVTTLTHGPSKGIRVARASKAVGHCFRGRLSLTTGGGGLVHRPSSEGVWATRD